MGTGDKVEEVSRGQDPGALGSRQTCSGTDSQAVTQPVAVAVMAVMKQQSGPSSY